MNRAMWIIAIAEVIRVFQNTAQLMMLAAEKRRAMELQDKAFDKYAEAMDRTDETWTDFIQDCPWK